MSRKWKRVVEAMKNVAFTYPEHLHAFVREQNWTRTCVCVCVCSGAGFTHTGHWSAVNFRPSRGTATKSIIGLTNVLLGIGISG